jgi:malonyl-CoA/methylmalonyl-CoA synthetase
MLSHANLYSNAQTLHDYWQWDDKRDVLLHALPIFHVHGLFVALHCAMLGQSTIHFLTQFNIDKVIQSLAESTVMMGVPTFYTRLLDTAEFTSKTCEKMRLFISGSAPLLSETHQRFEEKTGHKILERYGMTECGMITSNPYSGDRIAGTVGFSLPDISVRVADEQGNTLNKNDIGVLEVKGPNVFSGYWQMPERTQQEFRKDGYFITGDLSTIDDQGRVSIVGRAKDLIISGGFNIYPKELESQIDNIPGVKESAVIGVAHNDFGEVVVAVIVQELQAELNDADILVPLQQSLANFKRPKKVVFVDELPRNTMGKVQKAQLRKHYQMLFCD